MTPLRPRLSDYVLGLALVLALLAGSTIAVERAAPGIATGSQPSTALAAPSDSITVFASPGRSDQGNPDPPPATNRIVPIVSSAPAPTAAIGALYSASATWCAPTATMCQSWAPPARLAAVNGFRWGDAPYWVRVWRGDLFSDALVVSFCRCRDTDAAIDLSVEAWNALSPGRPAGSKTDPGRIAVEVEVLTWPGDSADPPPHPDDERGRIEDGGPQQEETR